jgi:hypothetical protein
MENDAVISRNGRRDEIRLILEAARLVLLLLGIVAVIFTAFQWRTSNDLTKESMHITTESLWRKQSEFFIERPYLRTYFYESSRVEAENENSSEILATADARLDVMNAILTYADRQGAQDETGEWENTFADAFRSSPILCTRLGETTTKYPLIVSVAGKGCS